ncbi:hypothetical protein [Streptomyces sp. NBC_01506]|uniref:hypothetical protein n=1 Tax=Streptomyces sp. NBC_01506 TaxID=2903887 RepID=UPI003868A733
MGSGSGGEQTLASSASDKKRAASFMADDLIPDTQVAARMADGGGATRPLFLAPTAPASPLMKAENGLKGLAGWALDQGVSDALTVWQGQASKLVGRLQHELTGLQGTKTTLQGQDTAIGAQADSVRLPSSFDGM